MKRTTVFVPAEVERDLKGLARRDGKPVAWLVREALTTYVASRGLRGQLPGFVGVGDSGATDVAERHEELLWTAPHGAHPKASAATARKGRRVSKKKR